MLKHGSVTGRFTAQDTNGPNQLPKNWLTSNPNAPDWKTNDLLTLHRPTGHRSPPTPPLHRSCRLSADRINPVFERPCFSSSPQTNSKLPSLHPRMKTQTILPAGNGAWDLTSYPFGGDFIRPSTDLVISEVKELPGKPGWWQGVCEYPNRKGLRTIASNRFVLKASEE